ncbi:MAG: nickel pincer cofactor biosynthesis protein LarC [Bacteroidota bacterium]
MKIVYFDTVGGIAGDMTLAALINAGMPLETLQARLSDLRLAGFELTARHVQRSAIDAIQVDVIVTETFERHRHLNDILGILDASTLSAGTKEQAASIFRVIAEAEARIHNTTPEKVHFHEVGAIDSIVDIVGTAICLDHLGIERVYSSPVRLGSGGTIKTEHGQMPTPAPAALEVLKDYPVVLTSIPHELTTPTGAAIIKALSSGVLDQERIRISAIGYGAGTREFTELPNLLRVMIGELEVGIEEDDVVVIETNIDDLNPQVYPHVIDRLLAAGAHDAYLVPIIMKKGRPGILLSAMAPRRVLDAVLGVLYRETSTIGLRIQPIGRKKLPRRSVEVTTSFGLVRAKVVIRDGKEIVTAEYEECRRIAVEKGMAVVEVMRTLERELNSPRNNPQLTVDK